MDADRKLVAELGIGTVAIVVFIGAAYLVSRQYAAPTNSSSNGSTAPIIEPAGGLAMIGVLVLFVLVMAGAGLVMYRASFEDDGDDGDAAGD